MKEPVSMEISKNNGNNNNNSNNNNNNNNSNNCKNLHTNINLRLLLEVVQRKLDAATKSILTY
jgi:hypothetical protein